MRSWREAALNRNDNSVREPNKCGNVASEASRSRVLDDFVNALPADATFYANLASKRAIPQAWAEKMRLKPLSAAAAREAIAHTQELHGPNALREAGLLDETGKIPGVLLADNVIIPYLCRAAS